MVEASFTLLAAHLTAANLHGLLACRIVQVRHNEACLPAYWALMVLSCAFHLCGALGVAGVPVPAVETGIALSGLVLGLMVALAVKAPLWLAAILVGVFAIFHGHAHGTELPDATSPLAYSVGFVIATGLLHLFGIVFGELRRWDWGSGVIRAGGSVIALAGLGFLIGFF